jgi:hypothetical protein
MAHYAHLDPFNIVDQVIVADADFIASLPDPNQWVQTSYNTCGGIHYGQDNQPDRGVPLRKNYAGIGFSYDAKRDAFIPPQPFFSWTLDESSCLWNPPVPYPTDRKLYTWVEALKNWVEIPS